MKFLAMLFSLFMATVSLQAQTFAGVQRGIEFADAYPNGNSNFQMFTDTFTDNHPYQTSVNFSGENEPTTAVLFTVDISPQYGIIRGWDKDGSLVYGVLLRGMVLEDIQMDSEGYTKYYYCNPRTENHITVYKKEGSVKIDYFKPGGYKFSIKHEE